MRPDQVGPAISCTRPRELQARMYLSCASVASLLLYHAYECLQILCSAVGSNRDETGRRRMTNLCITKLYLKLRCKIFLNYIATFKNPLYLHRHKADRKPRHVPGTFARSRLDDVVVALLALQILSSREPKYNFNSCHTLP